MQNDCPGGRVYAPSRVLGGMVMYEIDTCIKLQSKGGGGGGLEALLLNDFCGISS